MVNWVSQLSLNHILSRPVRVIAPIVPTSRPTK
uniref:Uncharacterized protein n=1 Tax=Nelumbo nucifera TaxID=4432 RepID=A0A822YH37_NELNU|nr:TPA_asm: hypothetical protein HUJ06_012355 [Nelumbo nucifera]